MTDTEKLQPIHDRYDELTDVLKYCANYAQDRFSTGERIVIHQERSALMVAMRKIKNEQEIIYPIYTMPTAVDIKITKTIEWMTLKGLREDSK